MPLKESKYKYNQTFVKLLGSKIVVSTLGCVRNSDIVCDDDKYSERCSAYFSWRNSASPRLKCASNESAFFSNPLRYSTSASAYFSLLYSLLPFHTLENSCCAIMGNASVRARRLKTIFLMLFISKKIDSADGFILSAENEEVDYEQ